MPVKVSVIVPVYNPGRNLDRCVASILGQSLPETDYEAIFVDDGSDDDSPARLDALAAAHPNVRVIHQENSGWPGQPRNVGIAAARGDYVFFLDHDDALGLEALERLHDFATLNRSDVVIGKTVAYRRGVREPAAAMTLNYHGLFARSRDHVTLWDGPIIDSLTPHKLFRRSFLAEHGLRFPEGRRRLEDHVFVLEAYFAASTISVLADPICYHHYQRSDWRNASTDLTDPAWYYGFVREVLGVVEAHTDPGPARDALLQRFARVEVLDRLRGPRFLGHPTGYRTSLFNEIRSLVEEHLPPTVDALLAPFQRIEMALVRAGRLDLIDAAAKWHQGLTGAERLAVIDRSESGLFQIAVEANLAVGRRALALERRGDRFLLDLPRPIAAIVPDDARAVSVPVPGRASVRVRRRGDSAELAIPCRAERRIEERGGVWMVVDRVEATIDPGTFAAGPSAGPATWDIVVRIEIVGVTREVRIARLQVTADHAVVIRRGSSSRGSRMAGEVRRLGLAGLLFVSRHMDDRVRRRLWHVAGRVVPRFDG
jgi:poly(ribitol-phosphate) beta-N-acetylglucosaminyltransferase